MHSAVAARSWVCAAPFRWELHNSELSSAIPHSQASELRNGGPPGPSDQQHQLPWLWAELLPRDRASDHCVSGKDPRAEAARTDAETVLRIAGGRLGCGTSVVPTLESSRRRLAPGPPDCSFTPPISGQLRVGGTLPIQSRSGTRAPLPSLDTSIAARAADWLRAREADFDRLRSLQRSTSARADASMQRAFPHPMRPIARHTPRPAVPRHLRNNSDQCFLCFRVQISKLRLRSNLD